MDAIVNFVSSWPTLVQRAFSEHMLVVAFITVAALGIFVLLQQEWRPYSLPSNVAFVAGGWLIAVSCVVYVMAAARKGWTVVEQALPFAAKLSAFCCGLSRLAVRLRDGRQRAALRRLHFVAAGQG